MAGLTVVYLEAEQGVRELRGSEPEVIKGNVGDFEGHLQCTSWFRPVHCGYLTICPNTPLCAPLYRAPSV